jgi:glycosyltransferase involved in cell wall biosynthesis
MQPALVTTIIPVFNRAAMLREAVASVLAQTYRPIEIIVVDDGSTDDTASAADAMARLHPEVRVLHQSNTGVGGAREAGRLAANGEFIQHLDSDDLLEPRKFELQVAGLRRHPECDVSYGWTRMRFRDGSVHPKPWKRTGEEMGSIFPAMLETRWWETTTPLYRASVIAKSGAWLSLCYEEDWEYDCRIGAMGVRLHFVEDWVSEFRQHTGHTSGKSGPSVLRDRATAHAAILAHARQAGIDDKAPEMRHFARELFLLGRQCGAEGLAAESSRLVALALDASGRDQNRLQLRLYTLLARVLGWNTMGRMAAATDKLRR